MTITSFDAELYLASNPDVLDAVGYNAEAALRHYQENGRTEGREQSFDAESYLAANRDLIVAFNGNANLALQHYLDCGHSEGRATTFNAREYLASNPDVLAAVGDNEAAATQHYVEYGAREGRSTSSFDAARYLASNSDLHSAYGDDSTTALTHYLEHGYAEGRETGSDDHLTTVTTTTKPVVTTRETEDDDHGDENTHHGAPLLPVGGTGETNGAAAGVWQSYEGITDFQTGFDGIDIDGALRTQVDHNRDGVLAATVRERNGINAATDELVLFSGSAADLSAADLSGGDMGALASLLGSVQGSGDVLVAAAHENEGALYQVHAHGGALVGSDISLLGTFKGASVISGAFIIS